MRPHHLLSLVLLCAGSICQAAPISFVVNGTFSGGGTFHGWFSLDGDTNTILASNITTSAGPGFGYTYTSAGTGAPWVQGNDASVPNDFAVFFASPGYDSMFFFWLAGTPASFQGGAIEALGASCGVGQCTPARELANFTDARYVDGGTVTPAPEPGSAALLGVGLAVGLSVQRRRK